MSGTSQSFDISVQALYDRWIIYLRDQKNFSYHTLRAYNSDVLDFLQFYAAALDNSHCANSSQNISHRQNLSLIAATQLSEVTTTIFRSWLAEKSNTSSQASIARSGSALKNFFRYIDQSHNISNKFIHKIKISNKQTILPKAIDKAAVQEARVKIRDIPARYHWITIRDEALLLLIYGCGLRISEAINIKMSDIEGLDDSSTTTLIRILGKGSKVRILPILPIVETYILKYISECPYNVTSDAIFVGAMGNKLNPDVFRDRIRKLRNITQLPSEASPHSFRHSFATDLLAAEVDIRTIQEMLGHSNLNSTQRYTKINKDKLREDYNKYHPISSKNKGAK